MVDNCSQLLYYMVSDLDLVPLALAQHTIQGEMAYAPVVCRLNDHYTENNINGRGAGGKVAVEDGVQWCVLPL